LQPRYFAAFCFAQTGRGACAFLLACFALLGEFIFFVPPKKTNQKKRGPAAGSGTHPWCVPEFPVLLGKTGARPTRRSRYARFGLEQGARLSRFYLRCSAAPTGPNPTTRIPWAQPSSAGILRISEPTCRAGFASRRRSKCCEFGERSKPREAQGTRLAGKPTGSPFFWVLFFGEAKKSTSPEGAKHNRQRIASSSHLQGLKLVVGALFKRD
jgi:hypothetical protein